MGRDDEGDLGSDFDAWAVFFLPWSAAAAIVVAVPVIRMAAITATEISFVRPNIA
jgi:hypothetical protein